MFKGSRDLLKRIFLIEEMSRMSNELLGIGEARDGLGATPATAIWRQLAAIYSFR